MTSKFKLFKRYAERERVAKHEYKASNFIPFHYHYNDTTVISEDYTVMMQVVKLDGFSFETADDETLDLAKFSRNMLFKGLISSNIGLNFYIVRRKQDIYPSDYSSADMPEGFAKYLDQKWYQKNRYSKAFANELYVAITYKGSSLSDISSKLSKFGGRSSQLDSKDFISTLKERYEQIEEVTNRVMNTLREYQPELLGIRRNSQGSFSEIAEFLARVLNPGCGAGQKIAMPANKLNESIINSRLYFGSKAMEVKCQDGSSKFAGFVSIKEYGPKTWAGILDAFLRLPFEFVISQSFQFVNRSTATSKMQLQQNRMIQSGDKALSQIAEITEALDRAMSGDIGFGLHHVAIMCIADSLKELKNNMSISATEITNVGMIPVSEKTVELLYLGLVPGNFDCLVRAATINTLNLASFNSMHNYPLGKPTGNYWGDAVTVMDTTSGTPYYFNFHLRDVGHTTIIGPTGAGKTVLMNFLCAQAQRFRVRLFFFDKDRGAEIFIRALGGNYTVINPGKQCGFNPLQLPDTAENRSFLVEWLQRLVSINGEVVTAEETAIIFAAVNGNYKLEPQDRKLRNIAAFFGLETPNSIAGRLAMWHTKGSHAKIFDNDEDIIDFSKASTFGFEMADLLRDKASLGPVLLYVFHRINISLDGTPCMIVLDEAWALIDNPVFAPKIKDWLKVLRKLNTFVVFATQSVEDASKSAISDTLIQQTATQIFLPNLKATDAYRSVFMLSEREYQLIKTTDPGTRFFLIKQGKDAVIARIDLSGMSDLVNILSGRADTVLILDEVRKEVGNDPAVWIPEFIKKVKEKSDD